MSEPVALYSCRGCEEEYSWPAARLRMDGDERVCANCWECESHEDRKQWVDLPPFIDPIARLRAEVARLKAEQFSFVCALEELGKWPDLPGVRFGAILVDAKTGETKDWTLRPEQVTGIMEAINAHAKNCLPSGAGAVKAMQEIDAVRAEVARLRETLDRVAAAIGDRLHAKGPLSLLYAHSVMRDIDAALAGAPAPSDAVAEERERCAKIAEDASR